MLPRRYAGGLFFRLRHAQCARKQVLLLPTPNGSMSTHAELPQLHPLMLEEAILRRIATAMSLKDRLALFAAIWDPSALAQPENMEVLRAATTRAAMMAQEALDKGNSVARPSMEELLHLLASEVEEVRLVGATSLRQLHPSGR
jgi:hypothetical protein